MVELEGGPEGEIESPAADGFEGVGEGGEVLAAEVLGPEDDGGAEEEAGEDAAERADPMVVDGPFEEEGGGDEKGEDADAAEELGADAVFEGGFGFFRRCGDGWRSDGMGERRLGGVGAELGELALEGVYAGGEGGEGLCDLVFGFGLVWRLVVRTHGNYFTACAGDGAGGVL
jgi:hypothetical protein